MTHDIILIYGERRALSGQRGRAFYFLLLQKLPPQRLEN